MATIKDVVRQTLINLEKRGITATPKSYAKEFCAAAKNGSLEIEDCKRFKEIIQQLSNKEKIEVEKKNIDSLEDLIPLLLKRGVLSNTEQNQKDIDSIATLLQKSMQPSISLTLNEDLKHFSIKIGDSPELIFEEDIQKEIERFIEERIELDQEELAKKAREITALMTFMTKFLGDVIDQNSQGTSNITDIIDEIEKLEDSSQEDLMVIQEKLAHAARSIEKQMKETNDNLQTGKNGVDVLQKKIIKLEKELEDARAENQLDHLTGLLTRRWYDRQSEKLNDGFLRNGTDYAIVFFDIDHFKNVNDTYGHEAGDVILATFAKVLLKSTRDTDVLGRYGGEEFVALVYFKEKKELEEYLRRIKNMVTKNKFVYNDIKIPITFSSGVTIRSSHDSHEAAMKHSDELLYEAKRTGRNKILFEYGKEI
jgi:diguanylate cyclase